MKFALLLFTVSYLLLSGCTTGYPLKSVDYNDLFTDGNSKIWIIDRMIVNEINVAEHNVWAKEALIFHENGLVDYIPLKGIGHKQPRKAKYYLDSESREMTIDFKGEIWFFEITKLDEREVIMKSVKGSDRKFTLVLTPLPPL